MVEIMSSSFPRQSSRASPDEELTDEQKRTLWVGGISEKVDEEILFELFNNVSK